MQYGATSLSRAIQGSRFLRTHRLSTFGLGLYRWTTRYIPPERSTQYIIPSASICASPNVAASSSAVDFTATPCSLDINDKIHLPHLIRCVQLNIRRISFHDLRKSFLRFQRGFRRTAPEEHGLLLPLTPHVYKLTHPPVDMSNTQCFSRQSYVLAFTRAPSCVRVGVGEGLKRCVSLQN